MSESRLLIAAAAVFALSTLPVTAAVEEEPQIEAEAAETEAAETEAAKTEAAKTADPALFLVCATHDNDIARLQCFDEAVASLTAGGAEAAGAGDAEDETDGAASSQDAAATPQNRAEKSTRPTTRRPTTPERIVEADEAMVEDCDFLGTVVGKSGWGGMASGAASRGSMRSAKKRAAKLGATHIVFGDFTNSRGLEASTTQGRAYACDP